MQRECSFEVYFRMLPTTFDSLLQCVDEDITKKTTNWQKPISAGPDGRCFHVARAVIKSVQSFPLAKLQ